MRALSRLLTLAVFVLAGRALAADVIDPAKAKADDKDPILWYDIRLLGVEGQGWKDTKAPFDRLPAKAEGGDLQGAGAGNYSCPRSLKVAAREHLPGNDCHFFLLIRSSASFAALRTASTSSFSAAVVSSGTASFASGPMAHRA